MKPPFVYKGKKPLVVSAETVFQTVKSIVDAGREEDFLNVCKMQRATVTVEPEFVNLAKQYLFEKKLHKASVAARSVVASDRCTPG